MSSENKAITVGISIGVSSDAHVWSNGLYQNIAFLIRCLRAVPSVGRIMLINAGGEASLPHTLEFSDLQVPLVKPADVTHKVDVIIEMGARLPQAWIKRMRALGAKVISFLVGHSYTSMIESTIFEQNSAIGLVGMEPDEVWIMEKDMHTSATLLRTLLRAPLFVVPHLWEPYFIDKQISSLAAAGHHWGFNGDLRAASSDGWGTAIFEPNVGVVKSCFIPMLICDSAYRMRPQVIKNMWVMNAMHMKEHHTFNRFATVLDLTRDGKASYEPRITVPECMSRFSRDVVVSHQWENFQNYLYYDVLYGGYPLVHNSPWLNKNSQGIFYENFEAKAGGNALIDAWSKPPEYWQDYKKNAKSFLATLHPENPKNVMEFGRRLVHSFA